MRRGTARRGTVQRGAAKLCGAWLLCVAWAAGCGGGSHEAAPPPSAPEAPAEAAPSYAAPESAQDAEAGAEYSQPPPAPAATGTGDAAMNWVLPQGDASLEQWEAWLDSHADALSASYGCPNACRALASLERAQTNICKLLGRGDPGDRCERAKQRVAAARLRVETQCTCPAP